MILLCCASELGLPEDLSAIEVILYYYYYYYYLHLHEPVDVNVHVLKYEVRLCVGRGLYLRVS